MLHGLGRVSIEPAAAALAAAAAGDPQEVIDVDMAAPSSSARDLHCVRYERLSPIGPVTGFVDYRMAKRALLRQVTRGDIPLEDVCDAHPELLRAARNVGATARRHCPICILADDRADVPRDETDTMRLVTYVFGDDLKRKSGQVVWAPGELEGLAAEHHSFRAYRVECCLVCGWNHLIESFLLGRAYAG